MHRKKDDFLIVVGKRGLLLLLAGIVMGIVMILFTVLSNFSRFSYSPQIEVTAQASIFKHQTKPKELKLSSNSPKTVQVIKVNEDNSFVVKGQNTKPKTLKLLMIEFPPDGYYGARDAHRAFKTMVLGKTMYVYSDKKGPKNYVYLQKGDDLVQLKLLRGGYATMADYNGSEKYYGNFQNEQDKAQRKLKGVWAVPGYVTDTGYHKKVGDISGNEN